MAVEYIQKTWNEAASVNEKFEACKDLQEELENKIDQHLEIQASGSLILMDFKQNNPHHNTTELVDKNTLERAISDGEVKTGWGDQTQKGW